MDVKEQFVKELTELTTFAKSEQSYKILSRLKTILADYEKAGFDNSANITKYIISEIEEIVKL